MSVISKIDDVHRLSSIVAGKMGTVHSIDGGRRLNCRMADLGLFPGAAVQVIANPGSGSVLIEVRGSRYTLGRGMTEKILIEVGD